MLLLKWIFAHGGLAAFGHRPVFQIGYFRFLGLDCRGRFLSLLKHGHLQHRVAACYCRLQLLYGLVLLGQTRRQFHFPDTRHAAYLLLEACYLGIAFRYRLRHLHRLGICRGGYLLVEQCYGRIALLKLQNFVVQLFAMILLGLFGPQIHLKRQLGFQFRHSALNLLVKCYVTHLAGYWGKLFFVDLEHMVAIGAFKLFHNCWGSNVIVTKLQY